MTFREVGLALMLKSGTTTSTATVVEFVVEPLTPSTVTVYDPGGIEAGIETVRVEVPGDPGDIVMLIGVRDALGPDGLTMGLRLTVPLNPFSLVRVKVDVLEEPWLIAREDGLGTMEKPGASTTNAPTIVVGWTVQKYEKLPAVLAVKVTVPPVVDVPVVHGSAPVGVQSDVSAPSLSISSQNW